MNSVYRFPWMVLFFSVFFLCLAQNSVAGEASQPNEYREVILEIIAKCDKKQYLKNSRSYHLRCCASKATAKAIYLRGNQERLINEMTAANIPLKAYRVERFVNSHFAANMYSKR